MQIVDVVLDRLNLDTPFASSFVGSFGGIFRGESVVSLELPKPKRFPVITHAVACTASEVLVDSSPAFGITNETLFPSSLVVRSCLVSGTVRTNHFCMKYLSCSVEASNDRMRRGFS